MLEDMDGLIWDGGSELWLRRTTFEIRSETKTQDLCNIEADCVDGDNASRFGWADVA